MTIMNQQPPSKSASKKNFLYRLWKYFDKKEYVSLTGYKIHACLSEKLKKQGVISSSSNLKLKKYRYVYETLLHPKPLLPPFVPKTIFDQFFRKFFCLQLRENTVETLVLGSSHGFYGYTADDARHEVNICTSSQDLYCSYELYKRYAHAPCLKNIVLFYSVFSPGLITEVTSDAVFIDLLHFFFDVPYRFTFEREKEELFRNLAFVAAEEKEKYKDFNYTGNCSYDFFMPMETSVESRVQSHLKNNGRNNNQTEYVRKLVKAVGQNNQKLLIVVPPCRSDYFKLLPSFEELFPDLLSLKDDVRIVSFLNDGDFSDADFGDMDHLNKNGAGILTEKIRNYLS